MTARDVAPSIVALGAFRGCEHPDASGRPHTLGIAYLAVMEWSGEAAVDAVLRAGHRAGTIHSASRDCPPDHFAVLDGLDADGEILADWCIPNRPAWDWWMRAVELRATSSDCRICEPAAWAAIYGPVGLVATGRTS